MKTFLLILLLAVLCYEMKDISIKTCDDLNLIRENPSANFFLENDIDCSNTLRSKSKKNPHFRGKLDGKNFSISNLSVADFKTLRKLKGATLKDIKFVNINLRPSKRQQKDSPNRKKLPMPKKAEKKIALRNPLRQVFKCIENTNFQNVEIDDVSVDKSAFTLRSCSRRANKKRQTITVESTPTPISTCQELFHKIESDLTATDPIVDGSYYLTKDIDCTNYAATPIGWYDSVTFEGTLEGNGHSIIGLKITQPTENNIALFYLGEGVLINNLTIENFYIQGYDYVSFLVAECDNCRFSNIQVGLKNRSSLYGYEYAGAVVGYSNDVFLSISNLNVGGLDVACYEYCGVAAGFVEVTSFTLTNVNIEYSGVWGTYYIGLVGDLEISSDQISIRDITWKRGVVRCYEECGLFGYLEVTPDTTATIGPNINTHCGFTIHCQEYYAGGLCGYCDIYTTTVVTGLNFNSTIFGPYELGGVIGYIPEPVTRDPSQTGVLIQNSQISSHIFSIEDYEQGLVANTDDYSLVQLSNVRVARQPSFGMIYDDNYYYAFDPAGGIYDDSLVQCKLFSWDKEFNSRYGGAPHGHQSVHHLQQTHYPFAKPF